MISKDLKLAIEKIKNNHLVAIPTETVYGLAARYDSEEAIKKIFETKRRPFFDPLIVHVASIDQAKSLVETWPVIADKLAKRFWPGPLTLVLQKSNKVSSLITSGLESVGIRMPNHPMALELIKQLNLPLAAPSANKFGKTSPSTAQHVENEFKEEDLLILEGGNCSVGIESTVLLIEIKNDKNCLSVLRKGSILKSEIENYLKSEKMNFEFVDIIQKEKSPGHMKHHYMPKVPLIICKNASMNTQNVLADFELHKSQMPRQVEGVSIYIPSTALCNPNILDLGSDAAQAARVLYQRLRESSELGNDCIIFYEKKEYNSESWEPILERLHKAATYIIA